MAVHDDRYVHVHDEHIEQAWATRTPGSLTRLGAGKEVSRCAGTCG